MHTIRFRAFCALTLVLVAANHGVRTQTVDGGVASTTGLVVSNSAIAADLGASILRKGGNAIDAAVATAFALAVTHPSAGNIGGGGYMLVRMASGKTAAIDYREAAVGAAKATMFVDSSGKLNPKVAVAPRNPGSNPSVSGYLSVALPGTVRGMELAHKTFGKLAWKDVVMPAARLATEGFALTDGLARSLNSGVEGGFKPYPATLEAYGKPGGGQWAGGDRLVLPDLGKALTAIAEQGADVFYKGWIADRIVEAMKANGGLMTKADLGAYQAKLRAPVTGTYRGYDILAQSPSSGGGIVVIEMLNILENFDLKKHGRYAPETLHLMIEAMRRAYLDRARYMGDPDFVKIPVEKLTSKPYAKELAAGISLQKASNSLELGKDLAPTATQDFEHPETTHFSVIDKDGNAVSNTYTLMDGFGSKIVVKGAGFFLNNEMGSFNITPGINDLQGNLGTKPNQIEPHKRALSSMMPAMVVKNGKVVLITGAPGARTIINTVLEVILNVTEFGMTGRQAVDAPRMDHEWLPDLTTFEKNGIPAAAQAKLTQMGHKLVEKGNQGTANSVWVDLATGVAYGENDKRSGDTKAAK
jgi:gamma-glutamyltranspeptidase/glutathione hydrolase